MSCENNFSGCLRIKGVDKIGKCDITNGSRIGERRLNRERRYYSILSQHFSSETARTDLLLMPFELFENRRDVILDLVTIIPTSALYLGAREGTYLPFVPAKAVHQQMR